MLDIDVLIVGGGASGLTSSLLLSSYGISTLLVSKYAETSTVPKAHLLSIKTMEMFRELGVEDEIRAKGTPRENMRYAGWYAGLGGHTEDHGREIARLGAWGRGYEDADWRGASETAYANLMQSRLEPLLKARAETVAPGTIRFNHDFKSLEEDATGVTATIEDRATGETYRVRARYLLACDGGRVIGPQLGVEMEGDLAIATNVSIHFSADLSPWARDPDVLIRTILNPDVGVPCVLVPVGPSDWGPKSQQWVIHFISFAGDHKSYDKEEALAAARAGLGLPDFDPEIHIINRWPLDIVVASKFRVGRTFILGDAAHRMPPSGGHGLNTAVQDCYNLCWKLAAVLRGDADDALLDSYEVERRPVAQRTVASAIANWQNARAFVAALDFTPDRTAEERWQSLRTIWDGEGLEADAARRRARDGLTSNLTTYNHLNINYGYRYDAGAIVPDGSVPPEPLDPVQVYRPTTIPGASVPRAIIEDLHGATALADRLGHGRFVLIAGEEGSEWCHAAARVAAARGVALDCMTIGLSECDALDMRREWLRAREFGASGAILVRPDRFIAWRAMAMSEDPAATLANVFDRVLGPAPVNLIPPTPAEAVA